eukprot:5085725-Pleurochrysis_carterae.AAC.1
MEFAFCVLRRVLVIKQFFSFIMEANLSAASISLAETNSHHSFTSASMGILSGADSIEHPVRSIHGHAPARGLELAQARWETLIGSLKIYERAKRFKSGALRFEQRR